MNLNICPVCKNPQAGCVNGQPMGPWTVACGLCGEFPLHPDAGRLLNELSKEMRRAIVQHLIQSSEHRYMFASNINEIIDRYVPIPIENKANSLLRRIASEYPSIGDMIDPTNPELDFRLCRACVALDYQDLKYFLMYLTETGKLRLANNKFFISPDGWKFLERPSPGSDSKQGFVAQWFDESMSDAWEHGIKPAVISAGYLPYRVDKAHFGNKIDDEIIAQIRLSRFLLADFTCATSSDGKDHIVRGGVYFEAGFAQGLGIPVIWSVKASSIEALHFDTRQYPHIVWNTPIDFRQQLENRIIALIGKPEGH